MDDGVSEYNDIASAEDHEAILNLAKDCYRRSRDHTATWRDEAKEDYAFVAGDQWSDADRAVLEEDMRPIVTFDRCGPIIGSIRGYEINNRQEVRFIPRQLGDAPVNDLYTGAAKWLRDECDAEDEESDAFGDLLVCGMGWTETRMAYDADPEGKALIDRFDPLEAIWDPGSTKRNLSDARWVGRVRKMPREDVLALADRPGIVITGDGAPWSAAEDTSDNPHDATEARLYQNDQGGNGASTKAELVVLHLQWLKRETVYRVLDPQTQQIVSMPADRYEALKQQAEQYGAKLRAAKTAQRRVCQAFICGDTVLSSGPGPDPERFTLRCMTGYRDRNRGVWFGLLRALKDPQRWANKFLSQTMHIINSGAKGGIIAEAGAFEDQQQAEQSWADQSKITWAKDGAIQHSRLMPKPVNPLPAGVQHLMEFSVISMRDVSGVNVETLGMADREQPGVLEAHRKQSAMTILAPLFDSLRRYRKEQGRVLLTFIREYLSDGRLIRIEGDEAAQYVPLLRQEGTAEYDVIVDDAPSSPNLKEQVFGTLAQMMPMLLKGGIPIPPEIVEYAPLPASLAASWKKMLTTAQQQKPQDPKMIAVQAKMAEGQMRMQMDQQRMQAELADDQRQAAIEERRTMAEMALDRERAANDIAIQHNKAAAEQEQDRRRLEADIMIAMARAEADRRIAEKRAAQRPSPGAKD